MSFGAGAVVSDEGQHGVFHEALPLLVYHNNDVGADSARMRDQGSYSDKPPLWGTR